MSAILEAIERERHLVAQIRAYLDERDGKLDDIETAARALEPLNFDPATQSAEEPPKPERLSAPRKNGQRAERVTLPGLPPPSRTQDSPNPAVLASAENARASHRTALSRDQLLAHARSDEEAMLVALAGHEPASAGDLAAGLGWEVDRARRVLQRLREQCQAQVIGKNRWAKWWLTASLDRQEIERPGSVDALAARSEDRAAVARRLRCRDDLLATLRSEPAQWTEERICVTRAWAPEDVAAVCAALLEEGVIRRNYDATYSLDEVWLATSGSTGA